MSNIGNLRFTVSKMCLKSNAVRLEENKNTCFVIFLIWKILGQIHIEMNKCILMSCHKILSIF